MKTNSLRPVLVVALLLITVTARGQSPAGVVHAPPAWAAESLDDDIRLSHTVTLAVQRTYLGALLNRVAVLTHVPMKADISDGAGDPVVTVYTHDMPLKIVMAHIWAMVSYSGAHWLWERSGTGNGSRYVLHRPLAAQGLPALLQGDLIHRYLNGLHLQIQAAFMQAAARNEFLAAHRAELYTDANELRRAQADTTVWPGLRLLAGALNGDQIDELATHPGRLSVPVSQLSPDSRSLLHSMYIAQNHRVLAQDGSFKAVPESDHCILHSALSNDNDPTPCIYLVANGGGPAIAGGMPLHNWYVDALLRRWLMSGDETTDPKPDEPVPAAAETPKYKKYAYEQAIGRLARTPLDVFMRVPVGPQPSGFDADGTSRAEMLKAMKEYRLLQKWRGGTLLIASCDWPFEEPLHPGWGQAVAIAKLLERPDLMAMLRAAAGLTPTTAEYVARAYPGLAVLQVLQPSASIAADTAGGFQQLTSGRGISIPGGFIQRPIASADKPGPYVRVRLAPAGQRNTYRIEFEGPDGKWLAGFIINLPAPDKKAADELLGLE